ncbi:HutD family protein [Nocardioides sp.]|uniref:HutD/Ves family protein n=1 Tax=Nocardioides sp. TaxID=35761 RepID=UPI0039E44010
MHISLDPVCVAPAPWRNGGGATRELHHEVDGGGETLWRISIADLVHDADFSRFPGLIRHFTPLAPLTLTIDGADIGLDARESVVFPGEAAVAVRLAAPTRALNVMTRRGRFTAAVVLHDDTADVHIQEIR